MEKELFVDAVLVMADIEGADKNVGIYGFGF
jgi:hypothetical protein